MKKYLINISALVFVFSYFIFSQTPVVKVSPAETFLDLYEVGEMDVRVENISGFRAYSISLSYDSQKLRCQSITRGTFFSNWNTFFFTLIDSNSNILMVDEAILGIGHESGSGDLFKIQFLALEEGDVNLNFLNVDLRDTLNNTIQVQTENGLVHIVDPTFVEEIETNEAINNVTAYPNPFNSSTRIEFTSSSKEETELSIYSITGEEVFSLDQNTQSNDVISFIWNAKDMNGNILPSGIYLLTANTKNDFRTFKLILLK